MKTPQFGIWQFPRDPNWWKMALLFGGSAVTIWKVAGLLATWRRNAKIGALIKKKRAARNAGIEKVKKELGIGDAKVVEKRKWITKLTMRELAEKLKTEELKPLEVLEAFQWAALAAHAKTNCVTEFVLEARTWCIQLQQQYEGKHGKPPLYGVPFSVKESTGVKGYDSTSGLSQFLDDPLIQESALVVRLRQLGAIPFVLTNVPQTLLSYNCSNPIFGTTTNPKNSARTSGGSSGGEAALLALRGSPIGLGSDLAGSIRIPSHFSGVTGLKPSSLRVSMLGGRKVFVGRSMVNASWGPMANDVDSLVMFMEEVLQDQFFAMDSNMIPLPFRRQLYESDKKLTIGYYDFDGFMEAVPACRRAVHVAKEILEQSGHKLVKFDPAGVAKLFAMAGKIFFIDAGHRYQQVIDKEVQAPDVLLAWRWLSLPICARKMISGMNRLLGRNKLADHLGSVNTSTRDLGYTLADFQQFKANFNAEWRRQNLDAVICPPCASVAMPNGFPMRVVPAFFYSTLYNMLDYPAGIVPVTTVTAEDEKKTLTEYKANEHFAKLVHQSNKQGTVGLPVGVQCVAATYNEEVCLRVMKEVEGGIRKLNG